MDTLHSMIKPHFERLRSTEHLEFEMRLGKSNKGYFDSNVGEEVFNRILGALDKYQGWEDRTHEETSVYYLGNIRTIIDEQTEEVTHMEKIPLQKGDLVLEGRPLDVRYSFAQEKSCEPPPEGSTMEFVRTKNRQSFLRKNLRIDMTRVGGSGEDPDEEEDTRYEIELEVVDPKRVEHDWELYNIIHKVQDLLNILV
jgi:hypothetical protein